MARRRRKSSRRRGGSMQSVRRHGHKISRRAWRASGFRRNPRRRRYSRNPSFSVSGIVSQVKQGAIDAALIVGGKAAARFLANHAPDSLKDSVAKQAAVQVAAALGIGIAGRRFLGADKARFLIAGGVAGALETVLKSTEATAGNVGALLGDDNLSLGSYGDGVSGYLPGVGDANEYGSPTGMGAYTEVG